MPLWFHCQIRLFLKINLNQKGERSGNVWKVQAIFFFNQKNLFIKTEVHLIKISDRSSTSMKTTWSKYFKCGNGTVLSNLLKLLAFFVGVLSVFATIVFSLTCFNTPRSTF